MNARFPAGAWLRHSYAELTKPRASVTWARTRLQSIPVAISLAVLISGLFAVAPVRDAATLLDVSEVHLVKPFGYVALAPLSDVLDAITLLSARQHIAIVLGLAGIWALWRYARPRGMGSGLRANLVSFATVLASIAAAYAAATFLPRPMAYLTSADPDILRIDFHSHTNRSRDARQTFSVERNRAWHRAGGYDVAYVTDHGMVTEVAGLANEPPAGNEAVILLPGSETNWMGEHVGLLGSARTWRAPPPIVIWNHPRDPLLKKLPFASDATTAGVRAIEISNGAPHGMDLVRRKRQQIVALARQHNLALVAGTDSHGWGYAAPNWTLLRLKHWRKLDRGELAIQIERAIREDGLSATRVVERATADPGTSVAALAFSVLIIPWRVLTTISVEERLTWLFWTWSVAGVGLVRRRRRSATT